MLILDGELEVNKLAFTPDGKRLLAMRWYTPIDVWSMPEGKALSSVGSKVCGDFVVHPSGRVVFAAGEKFAVIPLQGRSEITFPRVGVVGSPIISPDGRWLIKEGFARNTALLHGFRCNARGTLRSPPTWEVPSQVHSERLGGFLGDGDQFVTIDRRALLIRATATGELQSTISYPGIGAYWPTISPDGSRLAVVGSKLYLWNTNTWGEPTRIECPMGRQYVSLAFHPTRPLIIAIQNHQTLVKFLDADTGKVVSKFNWKLGRMRCVAFSPDGTLAAAGSVSGKIVVWDVDE